MQQRPCGPAADTPLAAVPGGAQAAAQMQSSALPWLLLAVHVSVGLLAAWWLRRGEAALHQVVRAVALAAFRPLLTAAAAIRSVLAAAPRPVRRTAHPAPGGPAARWLHHAVVRRGPPVPVTV